MTPDIFTEEDRDRIRRAKIRKYQPALERVMEGETLKVPVPPDELPVRITGGLRREGYRTGTNLNIIQERGQENIVLVVKTAEQ